MPRDSNEPPKPSLAFGADEVAEVRRVDADAAARLTSQPAASMTTPSAKTGARTSDASGARGPDTSAAGAHDSGIRAFFRRLGWSRLGLPAKLLLLTVAFVMLAEVLIFVPSVSKYRVEWLQDRLTASKLAALAAEAVPGGAVPANLRTVLLDTAKVQAVALRRGGQRRLVLPPDGPLVVAEHVDLRETTRSTAFSDFQMRLGLIADAMRLIFRTEDRMIRVTGDLGKEPDEFIEVVMPEQPLRDDMLIFGRNVLVLSIFISLITAALVYFALSALLVRPMMLITQNMLGFRDAPEDASRIIVPTGRSDEIGIAERELAAMQTQLSHLLLQRNRLAQLGLAVSKINHDLRNMLANAQLISDRLSTVSDPTVQRFAPKLIASLDRAINFCNDSLSYGRAEEAPPRRHMIALRPLVDEVGDGLGLPRTSVAWSNEVAADLLVDADRDHLQRVLVNLCRNAAQVLDRQGATPMASTTATDGSGGGGQITISATRRNRVVTIDVSDNGPGVPAQARNNLFTAFKSSSGKGGTGLGLVIAYELTHAHGGTLALHDTSEPGAVFRVTLPDRPVV